MYIANGCLLDAISMDSRGLRALKTAGAGALVAREAGKSAAAGCAITAHRARQAPGLVGLVRESTVFLGFSMRRVENTLPRTGPSVMIAPLQAASVLLNQ